MQTRLTVTALLVVFAMAIPAIADDINVVAQDREAVQEAVKAPGYSPYAGRGFPTMVLWGDTHVHTNLSLDARAFGVTLGPECFPSAEVGHIRGLI